MATFKDYYYLTKPGIIYGNAITAIAGFFLASKSSFGFWNFLSMLAGLSLIIASGCAINNAVDGDIDAKMERTNKRAVVTGLISKRNAIIFGTILGVLGSIILYFFSSFLALVVALIGWVFYVCFYTPLKRASVFGTLIGAVSGAVPPVVGYVAVTNSMDLAAWLLFFILVFWQMPHFYAIGIFRLKDYKNARLPVLPVVSGLYITKVHMLIYTLLFLAASLSLSYFKITGITFSVVLGLVSLRWLWLCVLGFKAKDEILWGRQVFKFSLIVLLVFSFFVSFGLNLP